MLRTLPAALLTALTFVTAAPAQAAAPMDAGARVERFNRQVELALAAKAEGKADTALTHLERALVAIRDLTGGTYDEGRTRVLYHKAMILLEQGRRPEARAILATLRSSPGLDDVAREVVRDKLGAIDREVEEERRRSAPVELRVEVTGGAPATVALDGREIGQTPVAIQRTPGAYEVTVGRAGFVSWRQRLELVPAQARLVRVSLDPEERLSGLEIAGWTVGGLAVATAVASGVLLGLGDADLRAAAEPDQAWTDARDLRDAGIAKRTAGWALVGVAGAALATSLTLLLLDDGDEASDAAVRVSVAPGVLAVGLGASF